MQGRTPVNAKGVLTVYDHHINASTSRLLSFQSLWFHLPRLVVNPSSRPLTPRRQLFRSDIHFFTEFDIDAVGGRE